MPRGSKQEHQDDEHRHRAAEEQRHPHLVGVLADVHRLIDEQPRLEAVAQGRHQLVHRLLHRVAHRHRVGAGLLDDLQDDGVHAVEARRGAPLGRAVGDGGDLLQPHLGARAALGHRELAQLVHALELTQRAHRQLRGPQLQPARRQVQVLRADALGDVHGGHPHRARLVQVHLHLDLPHVAAVDAHVRHALDLRQGRLELVLDDFTHRARVRLRARRVGEDGHRGDVHAAHHRRIRVLRQLVDDARDLVAHLLRRAVQVGRQLELHHHRADVLAAPGVDLVHAADARDGILDGLDDLGLDFPRARALVDGADHHHREGDVREEVGTQPGVPHHSEDDEAEGHHGREDRPANGDVAEEHGGDALESCGGDYFTETRVPSERDGVGNSTTLSSGAAAFTTTSRMPRSMTWTSTRCTSPAEPTT